MAESLDLRIHAPLSNALMRAATLTPLKPPAGTLPNDTLMPRAQVTPLSPRGAAPLNLALMIRTELARLDEGAAAARSAAPVLSAVARGGLAAAGAPRDPARVRVAELVAVLGAGRVAPDELARVAHAVARRRGFAGVAAAPAALVRAAVPLPAALVPPVHAPRHAALVLAAVVARDRRRAVAERRLAARTA